MRKFLSFFLSIATLLSLSTPALAAFSYPVSADQTVISEVDARTMKLVPTETDSVYQSATGNYFVEDDNSYIAVSKTDIPFNSTSAVQAILNSDDYSPQLKESIQEYYSYAVQEGLTDEITMSLYSSPVLTSDDLFPDSVLASNDEGTETHFGKEMRYQVLDYGTTSTKTKELYAGKDAFAIADSAVNLTIAGASLAVVGLGVIGIPVATAVNVGINGVSAAKSMLDILRLAYPKKTFTGTTSDFIEVNFHYRYYEKYISVNTDTLGWMDAVTTCKAVVDKGTLRVCLYDKENYEMSDNSYTIKSFTVQGENYADPWEAAFNHMFFALYEPAKIKVGDLTLDFGAFI